MCNCIHELLNVFEDSAQRERTIKWRCHNDATIPKVELWFQLWYCYTDFEMVHTFELVTQLSENCYVAENC